MERTEVEVTKIAGRSGGRNGKSRGGGTGGAEDAVGGAQSDTSDDFKRIVVCCDGVPLYLSRVACYFE